MVAHILCFLRKMDHCTAVAITTQDSLAGKNHIRGQVSLKTVLRIRLAEVQVPTDPVYRDIIHGPFVIFELCYLVYQSVCTARHLENVTSKLIRCFGR